MEGNVGAKECSGTIGIFGQAGDDRMVWNPGDDTDLNEGGDGVTVGKNYFSEFQGCSVLMHSMGPDVTTEFYN